MRENSSEGYYQMVHDKDADGNVVAALWIVGQKGDCIPCHRAFDGLNKCWDRCGHRGGSEGFTCKRPERRMGRRGACRLLCVQGTITVGNRLIVH